MELSWTAAIAAWRVFMSRLRRFPLSVGCCLFVLLMATGIGCSSDTGPKAECSYASQCGSCSKTCTDGKCVEIQCKAVDDCRCGWKCVGGKCQEEVAPKPECKVSEDCKAKAPKTECKDGKCVEPAAECRVNADCAAKAPKTECKDGECVEPSLECKSNADCTSKAPRTRCLGGVCTEPKGGLLGDPCAKDKPCSSGLACAEDKCRPPCGLKGPACAPGEICVPYDVGSTPPKWACYQSGSGRQVGEDCSKDDCARDSVCMEVAASKLCRRFCASDLDCKSKEECVDLGGISACLPEREHCGIGRPCPGNGQCTDGRCSYTFCPAVSCSALQKCYLGSCVPLKCPKDNCPDGYKCSNGACVVQTGLPGSLYGQCGPRGRPCAAGLRCLGVTSVKDVCYKTCLADQDCGGGQRCRSRALDKDGQEIKICATDLPVDSACKPEIAQLCASPGRCFDGKCKVSKLGDKCTPQGSDCDADQSCFEFGSNARCAKTCNFKAGSCPVGYQCHSRGGAATGACIQKCVKPDHLCHDGEYGCSRVSLELPSGCMPVGKVPYGQVCGDVQGLCAPGFYCITTTTDKTKGICTRSCSTVADCPSAPLPPKCPRNFCTMPCTPAGTACPIGTTCVRFQDPIGYICFSAVGP